MTLLGLTVRLKRKLVCKWAYSHFPYNDRFYRDLNREYRRFWIKTKQERKA